MSVSEREMNTQITWNKNKKGIRALENKKPKNKNSLINPCLKHHASVF